MMNFGRDASMAWELYLADEVDAWLDGLAATDLDFSRQVVAGIEVLAEIGPSRGRP
jgi:hypothetical protein